MPDDDIILTDDPTPDPEPTPEPEPEERTMLDDVKLALRLTTNAYDYELTDLINAGLLDLGVAGVEQEGETLDTDDALIKRAVITYCKVHFGSPADFDRLKAIYDEQKAQLATCTGYTDWGDS